MCRSTKTEFNGYTLTMEERKKSIKIVIHKMTMSGVLCLNMPVTVQFGKHMNIIDGRANDLKLSIPLAIDFMLCRSFEENDVARRCLSAGISDESNEAFVTLHISGEKVFVLNGRSSNRFTVTRYLHKEHIDYIYYDQDYHNRQRIDSFHHDLAAVGFVRICDPIISKRTCPTSSDLNQMLVDALDGKEILFISNCRKSSNERDQVESTYLMDIHEMCKEHHEQGNEAMVSLRSIELMLLTKRIEDLRTKETSVNAARDQFRKFLENSHNEKVKTVQRKRFEAYEKSLHKAHNTQFRIESLDVAELKRSFQKFMDTREHYSTDMELNRALKWQTEDNQMIQMQASVRHYLNEPDHLNEAIRNCNHWIDNAKDHLNEIGGGFVKSAQVCAVKIRKEMEKSLAMIEEQMGVLTDLTQRSLDKQIESLKQAQCLLQCTNQLAENNFYRSIDDFRKRDTLINENLFEAWCKGFSTLTLPLASEKEFSDNFIGNVLEFIDPQAQMTEDVVSILLKFMPIFLFATKEMDAAFEDLVKPLFQNEDESFVHEHSNPESVGKLPLKSLANNLMTAQARSDHPVVKRWFDRFRLAETDSNDAHFQKEAINRRCTIICNNVCYFNNGTIETSFCGESADLIKNCLSEWQEFAKLRHQELKLHAEKWATEKVMAKNLKDLVNTDNLLLITKSKIIDSLSKCELGMTKLLNIEQFLDEVTEFQMEAEVQIKINQEKNKLLKDGNSVPTIGQLKAQTFWEFEVNHVRDAITEFKKWSSKFSSYMAANVLPLSADSIAKFKKQVAQLQNGLAALKVIDLEQNVGITADEPANITNMYIDKLKLKEERQLVNKLNTIKMHGQFLDQNMMERLVRRDIDALKELKKNHVERLAGDVFLPEFDADIGQYLELCKKNEEALQKMKEYQQKMAQLEPKEIHFPSVYFNSLLKVLRILNEMAIGLEIGKQDGVIGLRLSTNDDPIYLFPGMSHSEWGERFSTEKLCDIRTGLSFIWKSKDCNICRYDLLDSKNKYYSVLFQLIVSVRVNPSLIIFNNTILGNSFEELQRIIEYIQSHAEPVVFHHGEKVGGYQIIVVDRSTDDYRRHFHNYSFNEILCSKIGNRYSIEHRYVRHDAAAV